MGSLRETASERHRILEPDLLIGRASGCALRINTLYVSARHARLRWTGTCWELKDLGSRNGTFLDGRRVRPGDERPAHRGARLAFGRLEQEWQLEDDAPPSVMAVPLDGGAPLVLDGRLLAIPSPLDPRATIYRSIEGSWLLEPADDAIAPLCNLQTFEVAGRTYRFCAVEQIAQSSGSDLPEFVLAQVELWFSLPRDHEQVMALRACSAGRAFELDARGRPQLLLALARKRLIDSGTALPEAACGWTYQEDLAHELRISVPQLNLEVFDVRRQFAALGAPDAASIIERRPRTRQLRIGTPRLTIYQL